MGEGSAARARHPGGASIPPLHTPRARLITAIAAFAGSLALAVYPALANPRLDALLLLGGVAALMLGIGLMLGQPIVVPLAIAALAGEFVVSLNVRGTAAIFPAAAYGATLLLVAEFAYWSLERRTPSQDDPGLTMRRAVAIALLAATALGVNLAAATVAQAPVAGSLGLLAAGVGAVVVAIAIVVVVVWRAGGRSS